MEAGAGIRDTTLDTTQTNWKVASGVTSKVERLKYYTLQTLAVRTRAGPRPLEVSSCTCELRSRTLPQWLVPGDDAGSLPSL